VRSSVARDRTGEATCRHRGLEVRTLAAALCISRLQAADVWRASGAPPDRTPRAASSNAARGRQLDVSLSNSSGAMPKRPRNEAGGWWEAERRKPRRVESAISARLRVTTCASSGATSTTTEGRGSVRPRPGSAAAGDLAALFDARRRSRRTDGGDVRPKAPIAARSSRWQRAAPDRPGVARMVGLVRRRRKAREGRVRCAFRPTARRRQSWSTPFQSRDPRRRLGH